MDDKTFEFFGLLPFLFESKFIILRDFTIPELAANLNSHNATSINI